MNDVSHDEKEKQVFFVKAQQNVYYYVIRVNCWKQGHYAWFREDFIGVHGGMKAMGIPVQDGRIFEIKAGDIEGDFYVFF